MNSKLINVLILLSIANVIFASSKNKRQDRVCPTYNICGDGQCQVTTHPSYLYQYVCKCNDGTYKFEPCSATTTTNKCSSSPCYPYPCLIDNSSPTGFLCQCGVADYRPTTCGGTVSGVCTSTSCLNGGVCVLYNQNDKWCNSFQVGSTCCQCLGGYTGTRCETDINECSSNPCKNSGVCDNLVNSYRCRCPVGWTGTNCELPQTTATPCTSRPCGSFSCLESTSFPNGYICQCGPNDYRTSCTAVITTTTTTTTAANTVSLCSDQTICKNQGVCYVISGTLRCVCPQGYSGIQCETFVGLTSSGCAINPCKNSGNCVTFDTGAFRGCICPSGYTGTYCEVLASVATACSSITCLNKGICQLNSFGSAVCTCPAGTTGSRCESVYFTCTRDGRFKDPLNCSIGKYIECVYVGQTQVGLPNGIMYIRDCPATLRYNPATDQCDYAVNVQC